MPLNSPLFSIVIPTYNHAHYIRKCLDSLIAQSYSNWEAIIINNFSSDNTIDIVESFNDSRIRLINFSNNGIIAASRNIGIKYSQGEWICFLDSDDWWYPEKLYKCLPYLNEFDLIYHDMTIFKNNMLLPNQIKGRDFNSKNVLLDLLVNRNCIANSSVVVKKELINKAGNLSEDKSLIAIEDYDLWIRISQITNLFHHIPASLGVYSVGSDNITSDYLKRNKRELYIFKKYKSLIPQQSLSLAKTKLNVFLSVNYAMANDFRYIKSLFQVLLYGSLKMKLWASFNLFFGLIFIKIFYRPVN